MDTNLHDVDAFLAHSPWLRRLAVKLADPSDADDLLQETWTKLATAAPEHADSPRGWLATVLRNARKMQLRARERRGQREASSREPEPLPDVETLLARAQQFRALNAAVEAMDEPFRRTILLHFFESISLAEIARRESCPCATVRSRLRTGLARLRKALDASADGDRSAWLPAFAALRPATLAMKTTTKLAIALGALAAAAITVTSAASSPWGPDDDAAQSQGSARSGSHASVAERSAAEPAVRPQPRRRAQAPAAPRPSFASNLPSFENGAAREAKREAIRHARLTRLAHEGMSDDLVAEAAASTRLLGDIEQMMMSEDASRIGIACLDASEPVPRGLTTFAVEFEGEPDLGTVITDVQRTDDRDDDAFTTCVRESLYLLSMPPPEEGGTQVLEVFFDTDAEPMVSGIQQSE